MIRVGDIRTERPSFYTSYGRGAGAPASCEVIWGHPQGRFWRGRFTASITGKSWTESFYFEDRRGSGEEEYDDENDCNHEQQRRRRQDRYRHQPG